jgi:hypothetical protein
MLLRDRFAAVGHSDRGAIRLLGAHIGGQFGCTHVSLCNGSGPALDADSLNVEQSMLLEKEFTVTGSGAGGAVRLLGARIGGQFNWSGASLHNDSGPALVAANLQVDQNMYLAGRFKATGGGEGVVLDLTGARVGGTLLLDPARLARATSSTFLVEIDGLTYAGLPRGTSARGWLDLLQHGTRNYAAQPYQQLAAAYRAAGDDRQTREILIKQRDDQLKRAPHTRPERWWGRITKVTLGYGYRPWKALLFLAGVAAMSCVLAVVLGSHGALAQTDKTAQEGHPCTVLQKVSVGLDLNLPIGHSVARDRCSLTTVPASATAAWLTAGGWVLQVLAWAFAALFIAGFTSAVRKT